MLIENESQWNTDDLRALTKLVMEHEKISEARLGADFLLVFKTCRKHPGYRPNGEKAPVPQPARQGYYSGGLGRNCKVVEIYSKDRLMEKNALDRLALTTVSDVAQDLTAKQIRQIASVIGSTLRGDHYRYTDGESESFEWAEKIQFRAAPKITRSAEVTKRKIQQLENEKTRIRGTLNREIDKVDQEIAKLLSKLKEQEK